MRIAIAHDYLTQRGGAERVVLALAAAYPNAPIYSLLYEPDLTFPEFENDRINASPINRIGPIRRRHRLGLPVYPIVAGRFKVDADVVIASTSGWAHGFNFSADSKVIAYCHNPARWLYQSEQYLGPSPSIPARFMQATLSRSLSQWDQKRAKRPNRYIANSTVVKDRIEKTYGRTARIIFPPVVPFAGTASRPVEVPSRFENFVLCVSRLQPYKNVDTVIKAAAMADRPLVVVGEGPERPRLERLGAENVVFLSKISNSELAWLYANAESLVCASFEDFGLTPVEASTHGTPTIALRAGGYLDSIIETVNGLFCDSLDPSEFAQKITDASHYQWDRVAIRNHAEYFGMDQFATQLQAEIERVM